MHGETDVMARNVFTVKHCAPIPGTKVHSFSDEASMLRAWINFYQTVDADIITGFNIANFDLAYII